MAYSTLRAEMARHGVMIKDLIDVTGKSRSAISKNLAGEGRFSVEEGIAIKNPFFPDIPVDVLFAEEVIA